MKTAMEIADETYGTAYKMIEAILEKANIKEPDSWVDEIVDSIKDECDIDIRTAKPSELMLCYSDFNMKYEVDMLNESIYDACEGSSGNIVSDFICPVIEEELENREGDYDEWIEDVLNEEVTPEIVTEMEIHVDEPDFTPVAYANVDTDICKTRLENNEVVIDCGYYRGSWNTGVKVYGESIPEDCEYSVTLKEYLNNPKSFEQCEEKEVGKRVNDAIEELQEEIDEHPEWSEYCEEDKEYAIDNVEYAEKHGEGYIEDKELWDKIKSGEVDFEACYNDTIGLKREQ